MYRFYEMRQHELELRHPHKAMKVDKHLHNEFEILYLFDGEQDIIVNNQKYTLKKGDCAVIYPTVMHSYTRTDNIPVDNAAAESAVLLMSAEALYDMFPETRGYQPEDWIIRKENVHENVVLAFNKIFEESSINSQIGWAFIIFSHTIPLLTNNRTITDENSDTVSRLLSYISMNFRESLTLNSVSEELGMNKYYISRIFSQKIKMSFREYISMLRSNYAASLIRISDDNFDEIASESGFESLRTFYRVFRNIYGVSPAQYREMVRKYNII